jgi:hypothetical protein
MPPWRAAHERCRGQARPGEARGTHLGGEEAVDGAVGAPLALLEAEGGRGRGEKGGCHARVEAGTESASGTCGGGYIWRAGEAGR